MPMTFSNAITKILACGATATAVLLGASHPAHATKSLIVAIVSISKQQMDVVIDGQPVYRWKVSTGRRGHITPKGTYKPTRMYKMWHSRKYDNAPMPHSVFFHEGYAVHATPYVRSLGRPASHGCVRLLPKNASAFYALVTTAGIDNTSIVIAQ